jgi:hypothetical protein
MCAMRLPGLPLEQDNSFPAVQLCGWWAIGRECVRIGIYHPSTRNLATRVMTDVAIHALHNMDEDSFRAVWDSWRGSQQLDTTLTDYVMVLANTPTLRIRYGCTDADLMIAADWLLHTRPPAIDQPRLFTYRQDDNGYKHYSVGRVLINIQPSQIHHETDLILCNRAAIHWSPTRPITRTPAL